MSTAEDLAKKYGMSTSEDCEFCKDLEKVVAENVKKDVNSSCQKCDEKEKEPFIVISPPKSYVEKLDSFSNAELLLMASKVKGLHLYDYNQIASLDDKAMQKDILKMILAINYQTNIMTYKGLRIESPHMNNVLKWLGESHNGTGKTDGFFSTVDRLTSTKFGKERELEIERMSKILDCGDQAGEVMAYLERNASFLHNGWGFFPDSSTAHAWGWAYVVDDNHTLDIEKPYISFDPRAREFGYKRFCNSCKGLWGLAKPMSVDSEIMFKGTDIRKGK